MIPVKRVYEDGVFEDEEGYFSKSFLLLDINYTELQDNEKEQSLINYSMLLNSIDKGVRAKLTAVFRPIDEAQFERDVMLPMSPEDGLDEYRQAMNDVLLQQAQGNLGMQKQIFLTVADQRKNYTEATAFLRAWKVRCRTGPSSCVLKSWRYLCPKGFVFCTMYIVPG